MRKFSIQELTEINRKLALLEEETQRVKEKFLENNQDDLEISLTIVKILADELQKLTGGENA